MGRLALAIAVVLISATGFAAAQFLPPYLDDSDAKKSAVMKPNSFAGPMPPSTTDQSRFYPPMPPPSIEPPRDGPSWSGPQPSKQTPSDDSSSTSSHPAELPPTANQSVANLPLVGETTMQPISSFSALAISPTGYHFWGGYEGLLWWERKEHLPANLVTTGLPTDAAPGALGQPNTLGLSGPGNVNFRPFAGLRLFAGAWLDPQQILGVEASAFVLQEQAQGFSFNSTLGGNPLLALRHFDPPNEASDAFVIASPSTRSGGIAINTTSQLWGADANLLHTYYGTNCFRLVGLFGVRYLDLSEALSIQTRSMAIDGSTESFLGQSFAAPAYELTADRFHARSQFFGGQVGLRCEYYFAHFFVAAISKLAVGQTDEVVNAMGVSTLQIGNTPVLKTAGGLYALPSNSGHFVNTDLGIVPELQLKGGVLLTRWLRATIGYDALYWSRVVRVGDTLDLTVDARQVPTSRSFQPNTAAHSPQPALHASSFWVQGLTLGLEFTY